MLLTPLFKFPGNKRKLLNRLMPLFPSAFGKYIEPFTGSASVFAGLHNAGLLAQVDEIVLADASQELVSLYRNIRDAEQEVIDLAYEHADALQNADDAKHAYYSLRDKYLDLSQDEWLAPQGSAMLFCMLRTCFNGIWKCYGMKGRGKGRFTSPFGGLQKQIVNDDLLHAWSDALQGVELKIANGLAIVQTYYSDANAFIYCDPPYRSEPNASAIGYSVDGEWSDESLVQLLTYAVQGKASIGISNRMLGDAFYKSFDLYASTFDYSYTAQRNGANKSIELYLRNYGR